MPGDTSAVRAFPQRFQMFERRFHFRFGADNADIGLHHLLQIALHRIRILFGAAFERCQCLAGEDVDLVLLDLAQRIFRCEFCGEFAGTFSENHNIRKGIAAEPVRAIDAGGALTSRK